MAPEQGVSTKHADARADIYSLGCTLHYLLIGKAAYGGETVMAKLLAHHHHADSRSMPAARPRCPSRSGRLPQDGGQERSKTATRR